MGTLPFVIQPRLSPIIEEIGTPESGTILVERRGYLTAGEKSMVQSFLQSEQGAISVISVSREIAKQFNIDIEKAYTYLLEVITSSKYTDPKICSKIQTEFYEKIEHLIAELSNTQSKTEMIQAAAIIVNRVDKDYPIAEITSIHPDIIAQLSELYQDEEKKSIEKLEQALGKKEEAPSIEETEKKPSLETVDG